MRIDGYGQPASAEDRYELLTLLIEVTKKCNAACDQCGSRCDIDSEELLTLDELTELFADIRDNIGTDVMINITGGEPLMRRDLFELMTRASSMGFDWGMVTNGSLITDEVIEKMRSSGMKTVTVSIDGMEKTHEELRHLPGSWKRILEALEKLKKAAFLDHLQVTFTANRRNVSEFEDLYAVLNRMGLDSIRVSVIDPIGRALDNTGLLLTREEILYFTTLVNRLNRVPGATPIVWGCPHFLGGLVDGRRFYCFAGKYSASVLANGDIFVCPNVPHRPELIQGNILQDSFSRVWRDGFGVFRNRSLPAKCADCSHRHGCAGDSLHTMDFEKNEPLFCFRDFIEKPDAERLKRDLFARYPDTRFYEVPGEEGSPELIIEPEAFRFISGYFHLGTVHPQSMYEQQMALIGFTYGDVSVVRYVIPCDGAHRREDNAIFSKKILKTVDKELEIINTNYYRSSDASLPGSECSGSAPMRFLGFIHSHPGQSELQYSTGDDAIHMRMLKRYGSYFGVLVNPPESTMGAYFGAGLRQAGLIIPGTG